MADAIIDLAGPEEMPLICDLYNEIVRPARDLEALRSRFRSRHNLLMLVARLDDKPVGFTVGFEVEPGVFSSWFYGVVLAARRQGIASQLMDAVHSWAQQNEYESVRFECHNQHRPMLHLAIALGYDIVGIRWDPDRGDNVVIFEKGLHD
jgi:GNAT superfamily N-acetyltransferase